MLTLDKLNAARAALAPIIRRTDVIRTFGFVPDGELYIKTENLQVTGSFKVRGSGFKIASLSADEKAKGVIASSAGNHAQGVALSAAKYGIKATIFVPSVAPISKIEATRRLGAEVRVVDGVYDDAYFAAREYQAESGGIFVHPFDDEDVVAGQGTIGLEILEQLPDVEAVIVPIGGGGLIAGVAYAIKTLCPNVKIYGVQAAGASAMADSFNAGRIVPLSAVSTFADGISVKVPGTLTFDLCRRCVDNIVTVTDDEISAAILALLENQKLIAEGAGAVSVAAAMFGKLPVYGRKTIALVSGGNLDVNMLSRIIARGLLKSGRVSEITLKMLDKPGQLKEVATIIADHGANVTRVRHNLGVENMGLNDCLLHLTLETKNHGHFVAVKAALVERGYSIYEG